MTSVMSLRSRRIDNRACDCASHAANGRAFFTIVSNGTANGRTGARANQSAARRHKAQGTEGERSGKKRFQGFHVRSPFNMKPTAREKGRSTEHLVLAET